MTLKDNLKRARNAAGMSQADLAEEAKVSQQSISRLENGLDLTSKHLPKLAKALGITPADLDPEYAATQSADDELIRQVQQADAPLKAAIRELLRRALPPTASEEQSSSVATQPDARRK